MSYVLEALLGKREMLRPHIATFQSAHIVPLAQGIAMIPLTDELYEEIGGDTDELYEETGGDGESDHFNKFSPELEVWMNRISLDAPIAYVEAEFFGGVGVQSSVVWANGKPVLGPVHAETAINQALRVLGVSIADGHIDEFDAIGLGKHRGTESWLQDGEN